MELSRKITGLLRIWAVLFIAFALLIFFLPASTGKPLCLIFFMINGSFIILLLSWIKSMIALIKETGMILSNSKDFLWAMDSRLNITVIFGNPEHISGNNAAALLNKPLMSVLPDDAKLNLMPVFVKPALLHGVSDFQRSQFDTACTN